MILWCFLGVYKYFRGESYSISEYKYPPQGLYLSYGLGMCFLITGGYGIRNRKICNIITFISKNSLWIYLIHIAFLNFIPLMSDIHWMLQWFFVSVASCLACYIKNIICDRFNKRNCGFFKYLEG